MDTVPAPAEVHRLRNTLPTVTVAPDLRLRKRQREIVPVREHLVRPLDTGCWSFLGVPKLGRLTMIQVR